MNIQIQNIRFKGTIIAPEAFKEQAFVNVYFDKIDATDLNVEISIIADKSRRYEVWNGINSADDIIIENDWEPGRHLILHDIFSAFFSDGKQIFKANSISYGVKDCILTKKDALFLKASFTPGGLFGKPRGVEYHPDGNVIKKGRNYKDAYWETEIGTYVFTNATEYFSDDIHKRKRTSSVDATHVNAEIKLDTFSNLEDVYNKVFEDLILICSALTLASRNPVKFYEIEFFIDRDGKINSNSAFPILRRFKLLKNQNRYSDTLMHSIHLTGKKFHHLIMAIKSSNLSEAVKKSINFLALSRNGFIEQSYFYCFLALDYIIDEILKKNGIKSSIPSGPWGRIEKYLRKCIQENDAENLQDYFPEIISKLPELRRVSFNRKAMAAIKALRVNTRGIWVDKPFEEGLKEAAKIRNSLFHSGNINSYDSMNYNLIRLQFLLERIILRAINWKPSQCWNLSDQDLKMVNIQSLRNK